ncbi:hypothetical protein LAZ67_3001174 [Cordylochernes scorpioides]|uniref:Uncharacterized protein n=1 Tax=Cordylochernes scorpioides TaxID=51811 RepID=A0ABY6K7G7_9ARAC|nr:hypothetical protein LAZ67_3001174 [Cordylochernes scorpioides]
MTITKCFKSACCLLSLLCHCLHRRSTAAAATLLVSLSCPPTSGKAERYCQEKGVSTREVELRRASRGASKEELLRGGGSSRAQRLVGIPRNIMITHTPHFEIGDLVLVKAYHHPDSGKLIPYFTGPYTVIDKISQNTVIIDKPNKNMRKDSDAVHVSKLQYYNENVLYISPPQIGSATQHCKNRKPTSPFDLLNTEVFEPTEKELNIQRLSHNGKEAYFFPKALEKVWSPPFRVSSLTLDCRPLINYLPD